jgi:uncharacterized protein (TIGR02147 family)
MMIPNIYDYIDYRLFILDTAKSLNKNDPAFSFGDLARAVGANSPDFLREIRDRIFTVSDASIGTLAEYLGFDSDELQYFATLVAFERAKTNTAKDAFLKNILRSKEFSVARELREDQYRFFSRWYIPVIRELIISPYYDNNPAWIASRIVPEISEEEVKEAIELLVTLDLVSYDEKTGKWHQKDTIVKTSAEVSGPALTEYHSSVIKLGAESMERFTSDQRDLRAVTLSVSEEGYRNLKKRIEKIWQELLSYAETDEETNRVYQVNLQCFPVSDALEKKQ